jgi:GGDEF domain-containing protein
VVLMFLDLDRFKPINDSLGHAAGDRMLKDMATRLLACVDDDDTVARMGGDEFTLLCNPLQPRNGAEPGDSCGRADPRQPGARSCWKAASSSSPPVSASP